MAYLRVKDLKKNRELWGRLGRDRELVITKEGQSRAIMISVEPDDLESSLVEIRRALVSASVGRVRRRSETLPPADDDIVQAIEESRRRSRQVHFALRRS
ncbi:hypothetical protein [Desulfonatronum thioautotrophicum]|uniref:hypothetical protein n=1 Tax=Desulfonatronum thioautotrophicum TaxID=617001 RepID=UPI0005EB2C97|nr:hypothetical protein [Desulfonatronum thioautotrophicum]